LFFYLPLKCLLVLQLKLSGLFLFFSQQNDVGHLLNRARILNHFYLVVCYSLSMLLIFFSVAHKVDFLPVLFPLYVRLLPCTFYILITFLIIDLLYLLLFLLFFLLLLLFLFFFFFLFSLHFLLFPCIFYILLTFPLIDLFDLLPSLLLDPLLFDLVKSYYFSSLKVLQP